MYHRIYRRKLPGQLSRKGAFAPCIRLQDAFSAFCNRTCRKPVLAFIFAGCLLLSGCGREKGAVYEAGLTSVSQTDALPEGQSGGEVSEELLSEKESNTAETETDAERDPAVRDSRVAGVSSDAETIPSGYVYVCGAVQAPGVYPLHEGMRVYEAIALAGGFADGADEEWLNQAAALADGERLYVYTLEETAAQKEALSAQGIAWQEENGASGAGGFAGDSSSKAAGQEDAEESSKAAGTAEDGKVNLNTATRDELMTLSGIGGAKADAILNYREEHGAFQSIEEIQNISGIKSGVYEKIKDKITV